MTGNVDHQTASVKDEKIIKKRHKVVRESYEEREQSREKSREESGDQSGGLRGGGPKSGTI